MPDHIVRLRGPWALRPDPEPEDATPPATRVVLPVDSLPPSRLPLRLSRRFGAPGRGAGVVSCRVRLEDVPGLTLVSVNGRALCPSRPRPVGIGETVELSVGVPLLPRNLLELLVEPGPARAGGGGRPWGAVALVFGEAADPVDGASPPSR